MELWQRLAGALFDNIIENIASVMTYSSLARERLEHRRRPAIKRQARAARAVSAGGWWLAALTKPYPGAAMGDGPITVALRWPARSKSPVVVHEYPRREICRAAASEGRSERRRRRAVP